MADAVILHAQSVTETASTTATWVDTVTLAAASFEASKEYLLIGIACIKGSAGTSDKGIRFVHGTTPTLFTDADTRMDPVSSDERLTVGWLARFTQPGTTEDVKIQINTPVSGTITNMFSTILAIKLSDDFTENTDFYWNEATADTADAASLTDRASVTFTPNGTDTWLVVGQASWNVNAASNFSMRVAVDSTGYGDDGTFGYPAQDATNDLFNMLQYVAVTPSNASHTFKVQTKSSVSDTVRSTRVFCLNLNKFAQRASTYTSASDAPSTGGVWETEATLAPTPDATGNWVILASAVVNAIATDNLLARLQINPSGGGLASDPAYGDDAPDNVGSSASRGMNFMLATQTSLSSGASRTINLDCTQAGTGTVRERVLVAFPVALAGGGAATKAPPPFQRLTRIVSRGY